MLMSTRVSGLGAINLSRCEARVLILEGFGEPKRLLFV